MNEEIKCETYIPLKLRIRLLIRKLKSFLTRHEGILTGLAMLIVFCLGIYNVCSIFASSFGYNLKSEMSYQIKKSTERR